MRCLENDRKSGRGGAIEKKDGVMQLREKDNTRLLFIFYPRNLNTRVLFVPTKRLRLFRGRGSSLVASRTEHLRGHSRLLIREKTFMTIGFANHLIDS